MYIVQMYNKYFCPPTSLKITDLMPEHSKNQARECPPEDPLVEVESKKRVRRSQNVLHRLEVGNTVGGDSEPRIVKINGTHFTSAVGSYI